MISETTASIFHDGEESSRAKSADRRALGADPMNRRIIARLQEDSASGSLSKMDYAGCHTAVRTQGFVPGWATTRRSIRESSFLVTNIAYAPA